VPRSSREPRPELPPAGLLDWSASRHFATEARPCRYCGKPTHLRDSKGAPADKVCAEEALTRQHAEMAQAYRAQGQL
jgi:hypothetical protein